MHINFEDVGGDFFPVKLLFGYSWHVAVFFLIAGFYAKPEKTTKPKEFIGRKMKTLYKMCLCYYIPAVLLRNVLFAWGWYDSAIEYGGKHIECLTAGETLKNVVLSIFFAGREPILGAMWFVYALVLALIGYSLISTVIKRLSKDEEHFEICRTLVLLVLCVISCTLTQKLGFMIPRFSNIFTAMWLIHVGFLLKNEVKLRFDNKWLALVSCLMVYHLSVNVGGMALNGNSFRDVGYLTVMSVSALYAICFMSKKIESWLVGKFLAKCGEDSFHIMALHFVGFKFCALLLIALGLEVRLAELSPSTGYNVGLLLAYATLGISFPLVFIRLFRKIKGTIKGCRSAKP